MLYSDELVGSITSLVQQLCDQWDEDVSARHHNAESYELTVQGLSAAGQILDHITVMAPEPLFKRFLLSRETALLQSCTRAFNHIAMPSDGTLRWKFISKIESRIYDTIAGHYVDFVARMADMSSSILTNQHIPPPFLSKIQDESICHWSDFMVNFQRLDRVLVLQISYPRCQRAGCDRSMRSSDHSLRVCGGCRLVYYCSRHCQKIAWIDSIAHRDVCTAMATYHGQLSYCSSAKKSWLIRTISSISYPPSLLRLI